MKISLLLVFWSLWFLNFSSRTIFSPILPIIEQELVLSHAKAGSLFTFLSAGYTSMLVLAGFLSPRVGYKRFIVLGFLVMSLTHFLLKGAESYWSLASFMLLMGMGTGIYIPSIMPILTATFDSNKWGKTIALHDTAASFSIFAMPILVAIALHYVYWRTLFLILSAACMAGLTVFWLSSPDPRTRGEEGMRFLDMVGRSDFWVMAILWTFAAASNMGVYNVIPLFLINERGIPLDLANTIFGFSRVGGLFVSVLIGFLADRYGAKTILVLAFLTTGISTIGVALARPFALLVFMLFLQASVSIAFFPVGLLAISKLTNLRERSVFTGATVAVGVVFGSGLTPVLLGATADTWSFQTGILALGLLTIFSTVSLKGLTRI